MPNVKTVYVKVLWSINSNDCYPFHYVTPPTNLKPCPLSYRIHGQAINYTYNVTEVAQTEADATISSPCLSTLGSIPANYQWYSETTSNIPFLSLSATNYSYI